MAIVEKVIGDTEIVTSESGYAASKPFWTQTRKKGNGNWGQASSYKFLGFIYNPSPDCQGKAPVSPAKPVAPVISTKDVVATGKAALLNRTLSGTYTVTAGAGLHIRDNAGQGKKSLALLPLGTKVQNYGYYTNVNGVKWLYVQTTLNGVKITGFCSAEYLKK